MRLFIPENRHGKGAVVATRKKNKKRRAGWILFLLSLLFVLFLLSIGKRGFIQQIRIHRQQQKLKTDINTLKEEEEQLKMEDEKLDDPEYIEEIAREEYGMAKKDEKVYKVVPEDKE